MEPPKGSRGHAAGSITVWVCQQEKAVSGMTRRTTCAEVVRALLAEQRRGSVSGPPLATGCGAKSLIGHPDAYGVVEKWRGYERVLPGRTKLLRLWTAWGAERSWVRFVLVRKDAFMQGLALRAAEARLVQSKVKPQPQPQPPPPRSTAKFIEALSPELQRRIVRRAFRKLGAINGVKVEEVIGDDDDAEQDEDDDDDEAVAVAIEKDAQRKRDKQQQQQRKQQREGSDEPAEREETTRRMSRARRMRTGLETRQCAQSPPPSPAFAQRLETLVHVVISQDHTIRQQTQRLNQLDAEIEEYEARTHSDRVRTDGANYVHDAYALGHGHAAAAAAAAAAAGDEGGDGGAGVLDACPREEFEEYARVCGEVLALHGQLRARERAAERLALELERSGGSIRRSSPLAGEEVREEEDEEEEAAAAAAATHEASPYTGEARTASRHVDLAAERLKSELGASVYVGLRMDAEAQAAADDLARNERTLRAMQREFERLVKNIERMEVQQERDAARVPTPSTHRTQVSPSQCPPPPLQAAVGKELASVNGDTRDDDSDTGLSSMHSQDSDTVVTLESLV